MAWCLCIGLAAIGFAFGAVLAIGAAVLPPLPPPPGCCAAAGAAISAVANKAAARILSMYFSLLALLEALFFTDAPSQHAGTAPAVNGR
jgi:hypothetical protein